MAEAAPGDGISSYQIDGHSLRVRTCGLAGGGVPLVLCNGLGQSLEILDPLMAEFPDRPLVAFDAVGVGRSSTPAMPLGISDHAAILRGLLDRLGIAQYDLLGISWGGAVAQQLAHDDPQGCRRLVLAVTSAGGIGSWWGTPLALAEIFFPLRYTSKAYGNLVGPLMYGGEAVLHPEMFRDYAKHSIAPSARGYFGQVRAMCSWTSLGWLHCLTQPTLVISGLYDALIPAPNQALLAQQIPGAELELFSAGNLLMFSRRQEVAVRVSGFLDN